MSESVTVTVYVVTVKYYVYKKYQQYLKVMTAKYLKSSVQDSH